MPYFSAAKKILTTAERAGALKLADLSTIASAFDERVLVAVVRMLPAANHYRMPRLMFNDYLPAET